MAGTRSPLIGSHLYRIMGSMLRIRYSNGKVLQGILLTLGDQKVRVALKECDDAAEYRLVSQRWVSEDCEVVSMEFPDEGLTPEGPFNESMMSAGFDRPVAPHIM
jgi:hypothetical protein